MEIRDPALLLPSLVALIGVALLVAVPQMVITTRAPDAVMLVAALIAVGACVPVRRGAIDKVRNRELELDPPEMVAGALHALVGLLVVLGVATAKLPVGAGLALGALVVLVWGESVAPRVDELVASRVARRPEDVPVEVWPAMRATRQALRQGRLADADKAADSLPDCLSSRLMKGLIAEARAFQDDLGRLIFDTRAKVSIDAGVVVPEEAMRWLQARNGLLESLIRDMERSRPAMASGAAELLARLSGETLETPLAIRRWWSVEQERSKGADWVVARLWDSGNPAAARVVARSSGNAVLAEAAQLAELLHDAEENLEDVEWITARGLELAVFPDVADRARLWAVDGPCMKRFGPEKLAARMAERVTLTDRVLELARSRPRGAQASALRLMMALAGPSGQVRSIRGFEAWWRAAGIAEERFNERFGRGLAAWSAEDWDEAIVQFEAASTLVPYRVSAQVNLSEATRRRGPLEGERKAEDKTPTIQGYGGVTYTAM